MRVVVRVRVRTLFLCVFILNIMSFINDNQIKRVLLKVSKISLLNFLGKPKAVFHSILDKKTYSQLPPSKAFAPKRVSPSQRKRARWAKCLKCWNAKSLSVASTMNHWWSKTHTRNMVSRKNQCCCRHPNSTCPRTILLTLTPTSPAKNTAPD